MKNITQLWWIPFFIVGILPALVLCFFLPHGGSNESGFATLGLVAITLGVLITSGVGAYLIYR